MRDRKGGQAYTLKFYPYYEYAQRGQRQADPNGAIGRPSRPPVRGWFAPCEIGSRSIAQPPYVQSRLYPSCHSQARSEGGVT
jgi:hypothetical protein